MQREVGNADAQSADNDKRFRVDNAARENDSKSDDCKDAAIHAPFKQHFEEIIVGMIGPGSGNDVDVLRAIGKHVAERADAVTK